MCSNNMPKAHIRYLEGYQIHWKDQFTRAKSLDRLKVSFQSWCMKWPSLVQCWCQIRPDLNPEDSEHQKLYMLAGMKQITTWSQSYNDLSPSSFQAKAMSSAKSIDWSIGVILTTRQKGLAWKDQGKWINVHTHDIDWCHQLGAPTEALQT